jgi:cardiolipin synthase (CMP-forming)
VREVTRTTPPKDRLLTIPNAISLLRIVLVPVFALLIVDRDTTAVGFTVFAVVLATDWLDGVVARGMGQVSEVGKVLDPLADRIAIAAGLVALVARDAFPLWAALPILLRDAVVLVAGLLLLARSGKRIEVRYIGKVATFSLMAAIGAVAWGNLGYALAPAFLAFGWVLYGAGIVEMVVATVLYARDARQAMASE